MIHSTLSASQDSGFVSVHQDMSTIAIFIFWLIVSSHAKRTPDEVSRIINRSVCPKGGASGFIYKEEPENATLISFIPPIVYIKTTKTGSSTVASILHRMADIRDLTVMVR